MGMWKRGFGVGGERRRKECGYGASRLDKKKGDLQYSVHDMVRMVLWSARVAVVLVWGDQSVSEADAGTVLPDLAGLALDHHSHMVYSFHSIA